MHHEAGVSGTWTRDYAYAFEDPAQPASNRLWQTWTGGANGRNDAITYEHDNHGNMLNLERNDPRFNMRWDHRDMIAGIDLGGGGFAYYQYDSSKQRTRKRIEKQNGSTGYWERIYLGGYERYRRYTGDGTTLVEEIESHHLFAGEQRLLLVDDVITASDATRFRYQYSNHLGSAILELDDHAGIISYEEYHPYGTSAYRAMKQGIEAPPKRFRYTGMERDEESGLCYHAARYWAPWLVRWTSCDPAGVKDALTLYAYSTSPIAFRDTNGRQQESAPDRYGRDKDNFLGPLRAFFGFEKAEEIQRKALLTDEGIEQLYEAKTVYAKAVESSGETLAATGDALALAQPAPEAAPDALTTTLMEKVSDRLGKVTSAFKSLFSESAHAAEEAEPVLGTAAREGETTLVQAPPHTPEMAFVRVEGAKTVVASPEETALYWRSVGLQKEISQTEKGGKVVTIKGTQFRVRVLEGSDVTKTLHTHPTSGVALPSAGDIRAYNTPRKAYSSTTEHSVLGEKWPYLRREAARQGLKPPPKTVVKTTVRQDAVADPGKSRIELIRRP
jgi:RHS repeat-associated protein